MARPVLMRPGPTRVEAYCSKVLWKVPRWRRSKASTAPSCCTPPSAWEITDCEMPAAAASAEMFCTKVLKSPPQRAASAGVEKAIARKAMARRRRGMGSGFRNQGAREHQIDQGGTCSTWTSGSLNRPDPGRLEATAPPESKISKTTPCKVGRPAESLPVSIENIVVPALSQDPYAAADLVKRNG